MSAIRKLSRWCAVTHCQRGAIAVEMGLIAPVAGAIALGLVDLFGVVAQDMRLTNAARAGIEYAASYPSDMAGIEQTVVQSGAIDSADLSIALGQFCECPDGSAVSCADTCNGGVQNNLFLRLDLSQPARSVLASAGIMTLATVNAQAILRVR